MQQAEIYNYFLNRMAQNIETPVLIQNARDWLNSLPGWESVMIRIGVVLCLVILIGYQWYQERGEADERKTSNKK